MQPGGGGSGLSFGAPGLEERCRLCGGPSVGAGGVHGRFARRRFSLRACDECGYAFVADPLSDLSSVYDAAYYHGRGADPLVNYAEEVANPRSIRRFEWRGIHAWARSLGPVDGTTRWLDFGCGAGGLVGYLRGEGVDALGFEPGVGAATFRAAAPERFLSPEQLEQAAGRFDIVSAIEVLEHVADPLAELAALRRCLRPGGLLLLTTGNLAPYRDRIERWRYVMPEVHISFYEPRALAAALDRVGFTPAFAGFAPGWEDIYRFKVLKQLHRRSSVPADEVVPWAALAQRLDARLRLSAQPIGWAR